MLKKLILLSTFLFLLFSCGTREDETNNEQYVGVWKWVSTDGGANNIHQTPANTGVIKVLTLKSESTYIITENEIVKEEGTYNLEKRVTSTDHLERAFLNFSNGRPLIVESLDGSDLYLAEDANIGLKYHYSK